jgi:diphosphomevalonate decarboxylase
MTRRKLWVRAPSNIALIKYMGKVDSVANLPENSSLSMTLDSLCTWVELEELSQTSGGLVNWVPEVPGLAPPGLRLPDLSEKGRAKLFRHVEKVRDAAAEFLSPWGLRAKAGLREKNWLLRSANTFPEASGIASSASSFAAVTLAVATACAEDSLAFERVYQKESELKRALARLSRQGSGSSCRSFEGPWVLWQNENAHVIPAQLPELRHFVILVSAEAKAVSSSEAHARVKTSPLWNGRVERAEQRVVELQGALLAGDLARISRIAWSEFWEMHSLFHTCEVPFTYWKPGSIEALQWLAPFVREAKPPIVTMDAGPNIHLTVEASQAAVWRERLMQKYGATGFLEDRPGLGAREVWA